MINENKKQRETMHFDVIIVGAGPAGLSAACRLKQQAAKLNIEINVCVLEKGSKVGSHIISGAIFEPHALNELFPNWIKLNAPLHVVVKRDKYALFIDEKKSININNVFIPKSMKNTGNYIISLGHLCCWLAEQAEMLGVDIFTGFAAQDIVLDKNGIVCGIITGDHGIDSKGNLKSNYTPGIELKAKYILLAEGCRGHIAKKIINKFHLTNPVYNQTYGIGFKEIWTIDPKKHKKGLVIHTIGWPLSVFSKEPTGGAFIYQIENNKVILGMVIDLSYSNPYLSPFDEFQRYKHHPFIKKYLNGGERIAYGARAICKGGYNALPTLIFPGGALIGCDLGTLNVSKFKGIHTAMKTGMLAADAIIDNVSSQSENTFLLTNYVEYFKCSWVYDELFNSRNFGSAIYKYGSIFGGVLNLVDQNILNGHLPIPMSMRITTKDCNSLKEINKVKKIEYPKPDGKLSFDKLSSIYIANIIYTHNQPIHIKLLDINIPINKNLPLYAEPAQRYCPANVYEIININGKNTLKINAQNCIHCKTCDIKDPCQNINWISPEGANGPNYSNL